MITCSSEIRLISYTPLAPVETLSVLDLLIARSDDETFAEISVERGLDRLQVNRFRPGLVFALGFARPPGWRCNADAAIKTEQSNSSEP
jgi:hypothetical protein